MEVLPGKRAVALVSGGLDSVVSLARAHELMEVRLVLFMDYGQRAVERERHAVLGAANFYDLPVTDVDIRWLGRLSPPGMRFEGAQAALETLDEVWIPNRNGVLLNIAAAYAESYGCDFVITGFNREEAEQFPDNSAEYAARVGAALALSTRNHTQILSFTQDMTKMEILRLGADVGAPLSVIWSCYHGGERMCGQCASCSRLKAAMAAVATDDRPPLVFEDSPGE